MKRLISVISVIILICSMVLIILSSVKPFYENELIIEKNSKERLIIKNGEEKETTFKIKDNYISGFQFYNADNLRNIKVEFEIKNNKGKRIYYNIVDVISGTQNVILLNSKLSNQQGKEYKLKIKVLESNKDINLTLNENNEIRLDQIGHKKSYTIMLWSFIFMMISLAIILFTNVKYKNKKDKKNIFKLITWGIYLAISLSFAVSTLYSVYCAEFKENIPIWLVLLLGFESTIMLVIGIRQYKLHHAKLEIIFLILCIPIASMYCVFFMPEDGQDGFKHYARSYALATGDIIIEDQVPIPNLIKKNRGFENVEKLFQSMNTKADYSTTRNSTYADYHPILYIFPAIGIGIGKILNINPYISWYFAKAINLLVFIIMGYIIIKKMPKFKLLTLLYLMIPMNIYQCTSLSADTLINLSTLLLLSVGLEKYYSETDFNWWDFILIFLCSFILVVGKIIYIPILFAILFLMKNSLKKYKKSRLKIILIITLIFLFYFLWSFINQHPTVQIDDTNFMMRPVGARYVITNPLQTIGMFWNYLLNSADQYLLDFIGYKFVWSSSHVPTSYAAGYLIIILIAAFSANDKRKLNCSSMVALLLGATLAFGLAIAAMYCLELRSNPVLSILWGIQGRYFYPVFIMGLICLGNIKLFNSKVNLCNFCLISMIILQVLYILRFMQFVL